jgi:drug/metabolite transporter (DMT)-like permease
MSRRGWVLFALMSVIWGVPYLMIKVAVEDVSVPVLVFARTSLGAALLMPLAFRVRRPGWTAGPGGAGRGGAAAFGAVRRHWRPVIAFSTLEIIVPWWLLSDAEHRLSSSMSGVLIAAVPIMGAVAARLTGDTERLGAKRLTGLIVGFGGVALLAAPHLDGGDARSVIEVLGTALCYATAPLIAARTLKDVPTLAMTGTALTVATIVYLPAAVVTWPEEMPPAKALAALAGLGLICTALAFVVFLELIGEVGASRAMVFTYVNPAVAVVAGVLILGEELTWTIVGAFVLIIAGSALATGLRRRSRVPAAGGTLAAPGDEADPDAKSLSRRA